MNNFGRNALLWIVIILLLAALFNLFQGPSSRSGSEPIAYSKFLADVENGDVESVTIQGKDITGTYRDRRAFKTYMPDDSTLVPRLTERGVEVEVVPEDSGFVIGTLIAWFPMLLLIAVWIFFMRQMQSGGGKAMGFGRSRARLLTEKTGRVTFEDVAGIGPTRTGWPVPTAWIHCVSLIAMPTWLMRSLPRRIWNRRSPARIGSFTKSTAVPCRAWDPL